LKFFVEDCATSAARNLCRKQFLLTENNVKNVHINSIPAGVQNDAGRLPELPLVASHWHGRRRGVHLRHYRHCAYRLFLWMSWLD
jgi:hypothetical protein